MNSPVKSKINAKDLKCFEGHAVINF